MQISPAVNWSIGLSHALSLYLCVILVPVAQGCHYYLYPLNSIWLSLYLSSSSHAELKKEFCTWPIFNPGEKFVVPLKACIYDKLSFCGYIFCTVTDYIARSSCTVYTFHRYDCSLATHLVQHGRREERQEPFSCVPFGSTNSISNWRHSILFCCVVWGKCS